MRRGRKEKEKGKEKRKREKGKERKEKRGVPAGFAAAVASARCGVRPVSNKHAEREEGKEDRTAIGTVVGMADCQKKILGDRKLGRKKIMKRFELNAEKDFEIYF